MTETPDADAPTPPVLELRSVNAGYRKTPVLWDINLSLRPGSVVALLGANGAGKTTTLNVAAGVIRPASGSVLLDGRDVTRMKAHERARHGVCLIPEGRGIFRSLTVRENLKLAAPPGGRLDVGSVVEAFPVLGNRLTQVAGSLSGGEQQMLAMARAYLTTPKIMLFDELSAGLAPKVLDHIFESVRRLAQANVSLVIVEQYVNRVLSLADEAHIVVRGRISWSGPANGIDEKTLVASYLGEDLDTPASSPSGLSK